MPEPRPKEAKPDPMQLADARRSLLEVILDRLAEAREALPPEAFGTEPYLRLAAAHEALYWALVGEYGAVEGPPLTVEFAGA